MIDQATELRKLVLQSVRQQVAHAGPAPRLVVVTAGRHGAGVTSLAVNLAVGFAEHGSRVVVVDAALHKPDVAFLCGLSNVTSSDAPKSTRRDIHEVMQRGPAGIQVVPRLAPPGQLEQWSETAQDRLLQQLQTLGRHAEFVVLDAGCGIHRFQQRCRQLADDLLLMTTNDVVDVMDTYAHLKKSLTERPKGRLHLIVNRCRDTADAEQAHQRLDQACQRFLSQPIPLSAAIPHDVAVPQAATKPAPFVLTRPLGTASQAVGRLAALLLKIAPPAGRRVHDAA